MRAPKGSHVSRLGDRSWPSRSPSVTGSANVLVDGKPVLRERDVGVGGWIAIEGARRVLVNGRLIHRIRDKHSSSESCEGSPHVLCGDYYAKEGQGCRSTIDLIVQIVAKDTLAPISDISINVDFADGSNAAGVTDKNGEVQLREAPCGNTRVVYEGHLKTIRYDFYDSPLKPPETRVKYAPAHPTAKPKSKQSFFIDPCYARERHKDVFDLLKEDFDRTLRGITDPSTACEPADGIEETGAGEFDEGLSQKTKASLPAVIVIADSAVPYYSVLSSNKHEFKQEQISGRERVDLKSDDKDATVPYRWISDLQEDLASFGFRRVLRNSDGTMGRASGRYDSKTMRTVEFFQRAALTANRKDSAGKLITVREVTFSGSINGVVDDATKREIEIWITNRYRRVLRPWDPKGLLDDDRLCPEMVARLRTMFADDRRDELDLELYGPTNALDTFRTFKDQGTVPTTNTNAGPGESWHNYGCAVDQYFYSSKNDRPSVLEDDPIAEDRACFGLIFAPRGPLAWGGLWKKKKDKSHLEYIPSGIDVHEAQRILKRTRGDLHTKLRAVWGLRAAVPAPTPTPSASSPEASEDGTPEVPSNPPLDGGWWLPDSGDGFLPR